MLERLGVKWLMVAATLMMSSVAVVADDSAPAKQSKRSKKTTEQIVEPTSFKVSGGTRTSFDSQTDAPTEDAETANETQESLSDAGTTSAKEGSEQPNGESNEAGTEDVTQETEPTESEPETSATAANDSLVMRHSRIFRDSIPISRVTALSIVVPGLSQLYNRQAWKIPLEYATVTTSLVLGMKQNDTYRKYKSQYDELIRKNATRDELDPVQTKMIRHNTYRQLFFAGAAISYMAFLADGVINYPGQMTSVKKATTLSMIIPGAGQFYNHSYWKIPIVVGGFASMAYIVDWNNRGYKRFKLAYDLLNDGDPETVDEWNGRYDSQFLLNYKKQYRRNRDLAIIGMVGIYILNVVDAHIDANLKDYDISDDLSFNVEPKVGLVNTRGGGYGNTFGMNISFTF